MKITEKDIQYVAGLARLKLTPKETEKLTRNMGDIITWVDKLGELDTTDVKPMEHVLPIQNVLREDKMEPSYDREAILKNAAERTEECFKVPKVVE